MTDPHSLASELYVGECLFHEALSSSRRKKKAFGLVIVGDRRVLCCLRSTRLFLILTGLALLKHPSSVSSLPRADSLHLVQSWRPLSPLKLTWPYPCLIHDTVTCPDICEQHWQADRLLRAVKGNQHYPAVHPSHTLHSLSGNFTRFKMHWLYELSDLWPACI